MKIRIKNMAKTVICILVVCFIGINVSAACTHSGGEANCVSPAICEKCGETYGETNSENHTGGTVLQNQKGVDCGTHGYTGDTYCVGCNTLIEMGNEIVPTADHSLTESVVIKEPTATEKGILQSKCSVCGQTVTEELEIIKITDTDTQYFKLNKGFFPLLIVISLILIGTVIYYNQKKKDEGEEE